MYCNHNYKTNFKSNNYKINKNGYYDERGFWIPFAIGGLAGTALGYGISNNNYNNYQYPIYPRPYPVPYMQYQPYPYYRI